MAWRVARPIARLTIFILGTYMFLLSAHCLGSYELYYLTTTHIIPIQAHYCDSR